MDEACEQIKELTEDSWKFMIEQGLALKEYPIIVPRTVLEFARTVDYMYKEADKYTVSHTIKDMLTSLYVKPVLMWRFFIVILDQENINMKHYFKEAKITTWAIYIVHLK